MRCKYRLRFFSSKGAFVVMLWTLLISTVSFSSLYFFSINFPVDPTVALHLDWLSFIPLTVSILTAPLSGWLADAKFGNYRVFRVGTIMLFISTVVSCAFLLIMEELVQESNYVLKWVYLCLCFGLSIVGVNACAVTAVPLGLDQMPDASAKSITSFVSWFVCCIFTGGAASEVLFLLNRSNCFNKTTYSKYSILWALLPTLCMSVVLVTMFLISHKWLIIEPESPQSIKTIYRVLKFAAKHNAPLNRSAFTYWEETIPSRIDLGKSKYGGPYTSEQVEDVKTIMRLFVVTLHLFHLQFSFTLMNL